MLWILAFTTANLKNLPAMWAYLPAQAAWVFDCIERKAIPALLPLSALCRMQLRCTDGDEKLYSPIRVAIDEGLLPNCNHQLCGNHFRERGDLKKLVKPLVKLLGAQGQEYYRIAILWIRSWTRYILDSAEHKCSRQLFEFWLASPDVEEWLGSDIAQKMMEIIVKSFDRQDRSYLRYNFVDVVSYDKESSQSAETENSITKQGKEVRPNRSIHKNTGTMLRNNKSRELKNQQQSALAMERQ